MEKSGKKVTRSQSPKTKPSTETSPAMGQDDSSKPLTPPVATQPSEMKIPPPVDGMAAKDRDTIKFLNRYKIGKRQYELSAKIGDVIYRAIGGRQRAIETLKFSKNSEAMKLLEFCERLSWNTREKIPIEALCLAAAVDPTTIAGALVMAARDVSRLESALVTMREHPAVVESTARDAKDQQPILDDKGRVVGHTFASPKAQEMMHKAVGWLPASKGSSINVNVFDPKQVSTDEDDDDGIPTLDDVFGSDKMDIENFSERRRLLLEQGK